MSKGYTSIGNDILDMENLSLEAIALYIKIKRHVTKKNWVIQRESVKRESGLGEFAFRRVWKELQENGLLIAERKRVKGKFLFEFTLVTNKDKDKEKEAVIPNKRLDKSQEKKEEFPDSEIHDQELPVVKATTPKELLQAVRIGSDIITTFIEKYGIEIVMRARYYLHTVVQRNTIRDVYKYLMQTIDNKWYLEVI